MPTTFKLLCLKIAPSPPPSPPMGASVHCPQRRSRNHEIPLTQLDALVNRNPHGPLRGVAFPVGECPAILYALDDVPLARLGDPLWTVIEAVGL